MWFIKGLGVGLMVGTITCLAWAGLDAAKLGLGLITHDRAWIDVFFAAASGGTIVYSIFGED